MHERKQLLEQYKRQAKALLMNGETIQAIAFSKDILKKIPDFPELSILLSHAYQQNAEFENMLKCIVSALKLNTEQQLLKLRYIECLLYSGETAIAISTIDNLLVTTQTQQSIKDPEMLTKLAELYLHCCQYKKVVSCYQQALNLRPEEPKYLYNLASSLLIMGDFEKARELLEKVISIQTDDFDAYYARSSLSKKNNNDNNIKQLQRLFSRQNNSNQAFITLGYSLAKEFEDLAEHEKSFYYLQQAAKKRRQQLSYRVKNDVMSMNKISEVFSEETIKNNNSDNHETPIFIVGLPRSGTTLVERILSNHTKVAGLGEINNFAFSLINTVGANKGKMDLIEKSLNIDFNLLATRYTHATKGYGVKGDYLIDKTPLNFLYLGLIKKAFPAAKIIHIKRHPLASCYAMYKTLFRMGYPFSYSLDDLAEYYIAYNDLMCHWQQLFGDGFLDVEYRMLVNNPEKEVSRMLKYCQLPQQEGLVNIKENFAPSATASLAQVRQPIYKTSVDLWRNYAEQLKPLREKLQNRGICCE